MNIYELGFREIYNNFVFIKDVSLLKSEGKPIPDRADGILTYCFTDGDKGISFRVLAAADYKTETVAEDLGGEIIILRSPSVSGFEAKTADPVTFDCEAFLDRCEEMNELYEPEDDFTCKIYDAEELDPLRAPDYPEDIMVYIYKNGEKAEGVWAKLIGITAAGRLKGRLLNDPDGEYGIHGGDEIEITLTTQGGETVAYKMFGEEKQ